MKVRYINLKCDDSILGSNNKSPIMEGIDGVNFSRREIDILACILSGRTAKKIAILLHISPKTVEVHIRNIMQKLECSSQAAIIDFVEKSNKFVQIKTHYQSILTNDLFEQNIKNIAEELTQSNKNIPTIIWYDSENKDYYALMLNIMKHLKLAGTNVLTYQLRDKNKIPYNQTQKDELNILFLGEMEAFLSADIGLNHSKQIEVKQPRNYYELIFDILEIICSSSIASNSLLACKKKIELLLDPSLNLEVEKSIVVEEESSIKHLKKSHISPYNLLQYCTVVLIIISGMVFFFIHNHSEFKSNLAKLIFSTENIALSENTKAKNEMNWNLPRQDHRFIGRESLLIEISNKLQPQSKWSAIVNNAYAGIAGNKTLKKSSIIVCAGLGGVGKTQLALQYLHHSKHFYASRIWFPAENTEQLNQNYIELARELGFTDKTASIKSVIEFVNHWLKLNPNCLIVFDNVPNYESIVAYLPVDSGSVLVTTRSKAWPSNISVLPIDLMTEAESITLVQSLTQRDKEINETKQLIEILGYLPLALAQASAHIHQSQISIAEYLELYKKYQITLLSKNVFPKGTQNFPVATTWNVSIDAIQKEAENNHTAQLSVDILKICAYLTPEAIPKSLLLEWFRDTYPNLTELELSNCIGRLWQYSLIQTNEKGEIFIHRLVQMAFRHQYQSMLSSDFFHKIFLAGHRTFNVKKNALEDEVNRRKIFPHLIEIMKHYDSIHPNQSSPEAALVLQDIGRTLNNDLADFKAAKNYFIRALSIAQNQYGENHVKTAEYLIDLGSAARNLREYDKAKEYLEKALKIQQHTYGYKHPETANALSHLGNIYRNLMEFEKSRDCLLLAIQIDEKQYGKDHLQLAATLSTLGNTYRGLKEFDKSNEVLIRALQIYEREYKENHKETAPTMVNMGATFRDAKNYEKAKYFFNRALRIYEKEFGMEHSYVAIVLSNLGDAYYQEGSLLKARETLERAIFIHEKTLGTDHPHIATCASILCHVYEALGNKQELQACSEKILRIKALHGK